MRWFKRSLFDKTHWILLGSKDTQICGTSMIPCYRNAQKNLFGHDIIDGLTDKNAIEFRENCNCIPGCGSVQYNAEVDRAKFGFEEHLALNSSTNTVTGYIPNNALHSDHLKYGPFVCTSRLNSHFISWLFRFFLTRLNIFYQNHEISAFQRKEQYTYIDFLSICGGLLGLSLGISVLSILECIYFFTLHLFWSIRKWKTENAIIPLHHPKRINHVYIDMPKIYWHDEYSTNEIIRAWLVWNFSFMVIDVFMMF